MSKRVPIINLGKSDWPEQLSQAFKETGFCYITEHGIDKFLLESFSSQMKSFFRLSHNEKMEYDMKKFGLSWRGYFPPKAEFTAGVADLKEGYYFGKEHPLDHPGFKAGFPMHGQNPWPNEEIKSCVTAYIGFMEDLSRKLMCGIAKGLGLGEDYFQKRFSQDETVLLRAFNYPAQSAHSSEWGVGKHTDMGFLTILYQDELGGLEVQSKSGEFISVPPIHGSFVVNIGDMLEYWTHGIYKATLHRVRNINNQDRLSIPFFYDPHWQSKLTPIDISLLNKSDLDIAMKGRDQKRWDGLSLHEISEETTYGEFVWNKIKDVFPELANQ